MRHRRLHVPFAVARRLRPGVGVERGLAESRAGPEAGAGQFMRIRLLHHPVRAVRRAARMQGRAAPREARNREIRSEEHTSELQSLMRISYAVFCLHKQKTQ